MHDRGETNADEEFRLILARIRLPSTSYADTDQLPKTSSYGKLLSLPGIFVELGKCQS